MNLNPPHQLVLEVAAVCQLKCPQCWTGLRWIERDKHLMQMDLFDRVMDEARHFVKHVYAHNWGEPTLNKNLPAMIQRIKQTGATIDLATHGLGLTEEMIDAICECDTLSVSIDGITQEVYELYRVGGRLDEAMQMLRTLAEKRNGKVNWTFIVFKSNEHQIPMAEIIAKELGVNLGLKPPLFWDRSKMDATMPNDPKFHRYVYQDGEWRLKADRSKCREFWETTYILPNGDVVTCCYDGAARYVVGNVWQNTLLKVWNGDAYNLMRENHVSGNLNEMCKQYCQLPA